MALIEKGEFTLKSDFEEQLMDQYMEVRIPHARSGLSPLVFTVHLHGIRSGSTSDFVSHDVLIQHGPVKLLVAHQLGSEITHRRSSFIHPKSDYLNATFFQSGYDDPQNYKFTFVTTGHLYDTYPHSVHVGEKYEWSQQCIDGYQIADWFRVVTEEGEMRVFEVGNNIKGSNRIALPKDLRPFVGDRKDNTFVPPQADLVTAVGFSCYEP